MPKFNLSGLKKYTMIFVLILLMILFSVASPYFFTLRNLINIVTQNTYFIIGAVGLSFVMIGGGIDLSVGFQMSLVGVVTAMCMTVFKLPVWLSVSIGLLLGTILGLLNGLIVTNIKVFPLIVTLATSMVFQGASYLVSKAQTFRNYPDSFQWITKGKLLGMPVDVLLTIIIVLAASFIYAKTKYGWNVLALGGNEEASRLAGIKTKANQGICLCALWFLFCSRHNGHDLKIKYNRHLILDLVLSLPVLTAAIVGGVSFMGGEGNMLGLVTGVFILAVLGNGMQLAGWGTYAQYIVRGLILLGAVAFDEYQRMSRTTKKITGSSVEKTNA